MVGVAGITAVLAVWLVLALYLALGRMCSQWLGMFNWLWAADPLGKQLGEPELFLGDLCGWWSCAPELIPGVFVCNVCSGAPPAASPANENTAAKQQLWGPGFSWCLLVHASSLWDENPIHSLLELLPSLLVGRTVLVLGASLGERGVGCRDGGRMGGAGREQYWEE